MQFAPVVVAEWWALGHCRGTMRASSWARSLEAFANRYGKWLGISAKDIGKSRSWFNKHGNKAVFCRLVPGVHTLISIPAGLSSMPLVPLYFTQPSVPSCGWVY